MDELILRECLEAALELQEVFDNASENFKKCSEDANRLICLILKNHSNDV